MNDAAQQVQTPSAGSVLGGRFRIVRRIGEGGMGVVLEAENTLTGKRVAIKWMHPQMASQADSAERMVREARASARVRHPNVVDVYDVIQETGAIFLVMELLEGEPLGALLERGDTEPHVIIAHLIDAMRGVAAAHREGVIHRDIKPDNIFLAHEPDRPRPIPKVLDFGISKLTDREGGLSLTRTGMTLGTPLYMSYEQLAGVRDIDARTDVYAFGVILYEALTGQPPFNAETFSELIIKITTTQPPTPKALRPSLPSALSSIVETAMRRERAERTPSLDALISALEPFASREGYAARVTAVADVSGAWAPTVAAPTPVSLPISVPAQPPARTGGNPTVTDQRVAVTSVRTFETFSDPDAVRISSIPRNRAARSALVWGGIALALAATVWFATRGSSPTPTEPEPHLATPVALPQAAAPPPTAIEPARAAANDEKAAPETIKPAAKPEATRATVGKTEAARPRTHKPREAPAAPAPNSAPPPAAQEPRTRPGAPAPRAGRPQSTEF
jgi:eukaryotic-like serine/threonine-protein kinase